MKKFLKEHKQLIVVNLVSLVVSVIAFGALGAVFEKDVNELTFGAILYGCYLHPLLMRLVSKKVK